MQAERVQYLDRTNEEWRERERELEFHKPEFRESSPFRQFVVELELDHPYWKAYRNELDAPETGAASAAQTAAPAQAGGASNTIEELKQYKSLLDAGVLTEEEFAAKKRQLLGI